MLGIFVFLDVEGPPMQSLHAEYYRGWSDALIAGGQRDMVFRDADNADPITFWPGVYGAEGDDNTWIFQPGSRRVRRESPAILSDAIGMLAGFGSHGAAGGGNGPSGTSAYASA